MKHLKLSVVIPVTLIGLALATDPVSVRGEGLTNYGAQMCADAGIPLDECSLVGDDTALELSLIHI